MDRVDPMIIAEEAWRAYDDSRGIQRMTDISARVSTNHVMRLDLKDNRVVIAKLSNFGKYEHFVEDHSIINALANNLPIPYENFLARSLVKGDRLFTYRFKNAEEDIWVTFYKPMMIDQKLPRRLEEDQIQKLGLEFARFHKICHLVRNPLPPSSKSMITDIQSLMADLSMGKLPHIKGVHRKQVFRHCELFLYNFNQLQAYGFPRLPVFVDWNIGNFSVTKDYVLFSRWDYDWFRVSSRLLDFYFLSRVVSDVGDKTVFSYHITTLMEPRFLEFLKAYHVIYPLSEQEVYFLKESYRFFMLHYVINYGSYFFAEHFVKKLQKEAFEWHLPHMEENFVADEILTALEL